jgi:hypothetical protein
MNDQPENAPRRISAWLCTPAGVVFTVLVGIVLLYLIVAHGVHLAAALPYLLLLACPLMHLFHGHGGHGRNHHPPRGE